MAEEHPGVDGLPRDANLVPDLEHPRGHAERLHEVGRRGLLLDEQVVHAAPLELAGEHQADRPAAHHHHIRRVAHARHHPAA